MNGASGNLNSATPTYRMTLIAILFTAVVLRLVAWTIDPFSSEPKKDSLQYHTLACNLLQHGTFSMATEAPYEPSAIRMPGYPTFLAAIYSFAGPNVHAAKFVQIILGPITCLLVFALGRIAFGDERIGLAAAGLVAVSPPMIAYGNHLATEGLFSALLLAATYSTYLWASKQHLLLAILTGTLWGALTMIKPEAALLPVLVVPVVALTARKRRVLYQALIAGLAFAVVVLPWVYRNQTVMGKACLADGHLKDSTHGMLRLYRCCAERDIFFPFPERMSYVYPGDVEAATEQFYAAEAEWRKNNYAVENPNESDLQFWARHPGTFLKNSLVRLFLLCGPSAWSDVFGMDKGFSEYRDDGQRLRFGAKAALLLFDTLLLTAAGIGFLVSLRPKHQHLWIITATIAYFVVVYTMLHGIPRYRVPMVPLMLLLAVWAFGTVCSRFFPWKPTVEPKTAV